MDSYIYVEGLELYANHGVFPEEKILGQKFIFSLCCKLNNSNSLLSDDLNESVSYGDIAQVVYDQSTMKSYNLLERLAFVIIKEVFERYTLIDEVTIEINKPNAPLKQIFKKCGVKITLSREKFNKLIEREL